MTGFTVIPAVDIRGGKCVRLYRGLPERETVFDEDPLEAAMRWEQEGASLLHVVDLDGAFEGRPVNGGVIARIAERLTIPVQVGGGIRNTGDACSYIDAGVSRVIVGTAAFESTSWLEEVAGELGERLSVGLDVKDGRVAVSGWTSDSGLPAREALERLAGAGVRRIIYTNVGRDGTLKGPDLEGIEELARVSPVPMIASGGVGGVEDLLGVWGCRGLGVEGVIVGMALYRGLLTLPEALQAVRNGRP
ncbi:MAG: 1-(5-phosphoribosyl)-5-[(5-phosphoribosylamino)methylideneamino]imidazole-4-carboxamide isomerase [Actinobacteria bacterium]|nr:1-(5-phosphoribosyl)-5-[(5-phosphoribosylamino)methylideneamino]imidazole-4-carboxamide isomerase [Actinomycetota bacterium]